MQALNPSADPLSFLNMWMKWTTFPFHLNLPQKELRSDAMISAVLFLCINLFLP